MKAIIFTEILKQIQEEKILPADNRQEEVVKSTEKPQQFNIMKTDDDKRLIFGWASVAITKSGEQVVDWQNDIIDPEDLEETVYNYVLNFRDSGEEHIADLRKKGRMVESCMFTKEKMQAMGIPEGIVPEGWWVGFYIDDDDAWEKVKNGTYRMFSVEGKAIREEVKDEIEKNAYDEWLEDNLDKFEDEEDERDFANWRSEYGRARYATDVDIIDGIYDKYRKIGKADRVNGCGVLVVKDGKILTATRIDGKHKNQIGGPGGHIDRGEEPEEAAIREAYEEFGIECKNLKLLGILDGGRAYGKSAVFLCTEYDGEPETDEEEMTDCRWRTIEELSEERLFWPFEQSLELLEMSSEKRHNVAKTFDEILKFNPFHDARGRFASSSGFATYSANPKSKAGAMAINRSAQAGHGATFNSHKESQGENINQNYAWLNGGPGAKVLAAQGQLASQQPKKAPPTPQKPATQPQQATQQQPAPPPKPTTPPKPQKNYDKLGYADQDDQTYHQLYNGRQYYAQQKLTATQQRAVNNYLQAVPEPGSLYSHSQNMNYKMATGQALTGAYKKTHDGLMSSMHNLGYNVELTRYDHDGMLNSLLSSLGARGNASTMTISQMKKTLVGAKMNEDKFLSVSYNDFKNAPQSSKNVFMNRMVKVTYKAKASTQAMMPGKGPGGDLGELILAPTNGKSNPGGTIVDIKYSGAKARRKGTQTLNQKQIEIVVEI